MTNLIKADEITKSVEGLTKFNQTVEELTKQVEATKDISVENLEDKNQIDRAKRARLDLRNIEIDIEKTGKSYRDIFTQANKQIMAKQKELLAITNPEIARLKEFEDKAKWEAIRKERVLSLPQRKEKLESLGEMVEDDLLSDEELLGLSDEGFNQYFANKVQEKADKIKAQEDAKEAEQERQAELERVREETEKRVKQEAEDREKQRIAQEEQDKRDAEKKAKEEKERLEKRKEYTEYRESLGYTEETKGEFKEDDQGGKIVIYKKVGEFIK